METQAVYLYRVPLCALPGPDIFRRAGREVVEALPGPWRAPVVCKPNVALGYPADSGIIAHPAFVGGVIEALRGKGFARDELVVAEGGGIESDHDMAAIYAATGYTAEIGPSGIELRDLNEDESVISHDPARRVLQTLHLARTIHEAGTLLNVPKMKAHNFATVTLAVKNMQGMLSPIQHRHLCTPYPRSDDDDGVGLDLHLLDRASRFYDKLVDLTLAIHPAWNIIEGIVGRDGTGFNRGKNIPLGVVLAGRNPLAVDHVGATLMGFRPEKVGFLRAAVSRGLWAFDPAPVKVYILERGGWTPCPDWLRYRSDPPFELIRRDDLAYDDA